MELAVEAELGFTSKDDIERYGIAEFNARCREKVLSHVADWNKLTERIGFWIDLDNAYRTLDNDYIESVWWALRTIHDKGLLYERLKVVPYCTRDGTTLSSHELGQPGAYQDVVDPSVYVRFPVTDGNEAVQPGDNLLIWTTTPWTLVSNAAVAVDPDLIYVRAQLGDEVVVVAEALVERVLGEQAQILTRFAGRALEGVGYEAPFSYIPKDAYGPRGHTVLLGDFVTATDGTGLVHTAIAFGEDDFRLGEQYGLTVVNPVRLDGTYDERIGSYAGRWVKDADADLVEDLRASGKLLRAESYEHSYPHCWRCGTPLLYYAKPSWYIATSQIKDRLLAANEIGQLASRARQARSLRQLAGEQRRLGALTRALLGHAAAGLALCERARPGDRLVRRAGRSSRALRLSDPHRPVRGRGHVRVRGLRQRDAAACPR